MNEKMIEGSRAFIKQRYGGLVFDEDTFQVLDMEHCNWVVRATTTHNAQQGEPERAFLLFVSSTEIAFLEESALPALTDWCLKMSTRKEPT